MGTYWASCSDEDRKKEIERLAALDDASFTAAKSMVDGMPEVAARKEPEKKGDPNDPDKKEPKKVLRSDAGIDPAVVDDKPDGLVERLSKGLREVRDAQDAV